MTATHAFTIRPATPHDEGALLALTDRLAAFDVPAWRTARQIAEADHEILHEALHHPASERLVVVAEDAGGHPLGCLLATTRADYFTGAPHAHVEVLAVAERAQGRGIARALMAEAEAWARARRYASVTLNVFERNARARGLYEHLGYAPETIKYVKLLPEPNHP